MVRELYPFLSVRLLHLSLCVYVLEPTDAAAAAAAAAGYIIVQKTREVSYIPS